MYTTLSILAFLLTSTPLALGQDLPPVSLTPIMAINVNAGSLSSPCSNSIESITVNTSQTISEPGFGYQCYEPGIDFRELNATANGLTCITRTDNQNSLPAGVTNLGGPDGHNEDGHWLCAISGWPTVNCKGQNQMAVYDVTKNTYTWAQGGVKSFEVQCQTTNTS